MSINIHSSVDGLVKFADKTTKTTIKNALGYIPISRDDLNYNRLNNTPIEMTGEDTSLSISDLNGNIILRVDSNGLKTTNVEVTESLITDDDSFIIQDKDENVILKIDSGGLRTTNVEIRESVLSNDDSFIIQDKDENVILKVDSNGLKTTQIEVNENIKSTEGSTFIIEDNNGNRALELDEFGLRTTDIYSNGELVATQNYVLSFLGNTVPTARSTGYNSTYFTNNNSTMSRVDKSQYILSPVICYGGEHYHSLPFQQFTDETYLTEVFTTVESDVTLQAYITIHFNGTYFEISNIRTCKPLEFMAATESDWEHGYAFDIPYVYAIPIS